MSDLPSPPLPEPPPRFASRLRASRPLWIGAGLVIAWFAVAEVANYAWYGSREAKLEKNQLPATGEIVVERLRRLAEASGTPVKERGIGDAAMEMLKCSFGQMLIWREAGAPVVATTLKWSESSVVGGVDAMHNPGNCLTASGWKIETTTNLGSEDFCGASGDVVQWEVSQGGVRMVAFSAVFRRFVAEPLAEARGLWNADRLQAVLAGRRDAPIFILLVYLPNRGEPAEVRARFQSLMRGVFCESAPATAALP